MAEQFEEKKDNISEEEIKNTASANEDDKDLNDTPEASAGDAENDTQAADTVEDTETASDETSDDEVKKKGFFGKDKKDKKDKKDQKIDELTDQYRRTLAEFDNYRKRTEKEKTAMFEVGAKSIIEKLLPVIDSFERGLATVSEEQKAEPFVDGMDKIYKQLVKQLEDAGVKEIEAMDKEFDPNLHNAVMHVEDENVGENIIVEVFQKGYTYRDGVVRHSMVKVAN